MLAAAIWHNVLQPLDVSGDPDGSVDPLDVLIVINEINNPRFSTNGALIPDVPPGQSLPYFDVTCDSNVGPLDVLSIINAINLGFHDPSWNFSTSNVSSGSSGHVGISSCSPLLIEGDSLRTELNQTVVLPDDTSSIRVSFEAPVFDTLSVDSIRDAFEILVLDEMGVTFTLPFGSNRDASYNWSENIMPGFGPGTATTTLPNSVYSNPDGDYYYVGSVVPGDFNGDGHMDFAGRGNGYVDIWLYNSTGTKTFTRTSRLSLPPGEGTSVLSAADFTGDGIDDVVTATGRALSPQIGSLLHTFASLGDGTFGPIRTQPIFNTNSDALVPKWSVAGDLNNDGLQDLVITSAYSRSSVFLGNGNGTFQIGSDFATGTGNASGRNVYLRDLNADGHLDMLTSQTS